MTIEEHKTFDKLIELIITQGEAGKVLMDMLMLVTHMKSAYIHKEDKQ